MFLPALAILGAWWSQEATVNLKHTARISVLCRDLRDQTGLNFELSRHKNDDALILSVKDRPLGEVMSQIAWATFGKWAKTASRFRLESDGVKESKAERDYRDAVAKVAANEIAKYRAANLQSSVAPSARLLANLLGTIDPQDVVNIETDDWYTITNYPNPGQHAFGPGWQDAIKQYVVESKLILPDGKIPDLQAFMEGGAGLDGFNAQLCLYYPDGAKIGDDRPTINTFPTSDFFKDFPKELIDAIPSDMVIPLSEKTKLFLAPSGLDTVAEMSDAYRKALRSAIDLTKDPVQNEPLDTVMTDFLRACGDLTHRSVVANLDDMAIALIMPGRAPLMKDYLGYLLTQTVTMPKEWLAIRPILPSTPVGHQVNRGALKEYLANNPPSWDSVEHLRAMGHFLANAGVSPSENSHFLNSYVQLASKSLGSFLKEFCTLARLFDELPADLQTRWLNGSSIGVAELNDSALAAVREWAIAKWRHRDNNGIATLFQEPSRILASGLPPNAALKSDVAVEEGYATRWTHTVAGSPQTDEFFLSAWWVKDLVKRLATGDRLEVQKSTNETRRLWLEAPGQKVLPSQTFHDYKCDPGKFVDYDKLPAAERNKIESAVEPPPVKADGEDNGASR